jgi:hypothetical protein
LFSHLTPSERQALANRLAEVGISQEQFAQAATLSRTVSEALARAYSEAIGRDVTTADFLTEVLGKEGAGRLVACAMREVTGRRDLYGEP